MMNKNNLPKPSEKKFNHIDSDKIKSLIDTALGKEKADMLVANADLVNVYSGELLKGYSVAVKGDRIAYVGEKAEHTVGPDTTVIDAAGKVLIPGFVDSHTHLAGLYQVDEFLRYAMGGGTTTMVTETVELVAPMGYRGVRQFLRAVRDQPVKIFATVAPVLNLSPAARSNMLSPEELRRLLNLDDVVGLGETSWQFIFQDDERLFKLYAETLNAGKKLEGHAAGARGDKLAAYVAVGISSCHESTTAEEALERLRLGLHVLIREGASRRDLESVSAIKDKPVDFRRLVLCTDGVVLDHLIEHGYMEFVVQKAINLGFHPVVAIQMATLNAAEHFSLDGIIGGIAPNKYADMVILPDLRTIQAEMVISNGKIIAREGQILVPPRKHGYPRSARRSIHLPRKLKPADFQVRAEGRDGSVTVRVISLVTSLVTREEQLSITPRNGLLETDVERDILKVAYIDRTNSPGQMYTGFLKGFGMKKGALATSETWGISGITVIGTTDEDMADAVNRIKTLHGGFVLYAEGKVLAEVPMDIGGYVSELSIETVTRRHAEIQQIATELGVSHESAYLALIALTTNVIPFLRICEAGLMDVGKGEIVDLFV